MSSGGGNERCPNCGEIYYARGTGRKCGCAGLRDRVRELEQVLKTIRGIASGAPAEFQGQHVPAMREAVTLNQALLEIWNQANQVLEKEPDPAPATRFICARDPSM